MRSRYIQICQTALKDPESSRFNEPRQLVTSDDIESDYLLWMNISYF